MCWFDQLLSLFSSPLLQKQAPEDRDPVCDILHTWNSTQINDRMNGWMDWWHASFLKSQPLECSTPKRQIRWQLSLPLLFFFTASLDCLGRWAQRGQGRSSTLQLPIPKRALSGASVLFLIFPFSSALWVNIFSSSEWEDQRCSLSSGEKRPFNLP